MSTTHRLSTRAPTRAARVRAAYEVTSARYRPKRRLTRPKKNAATLPAKIQSATATPAPREPDGRGEARPEPRKGDEREERPEAGRECDEERAQAEDRNADREEAGGVPSIRHDSEEELEDRRDDERRPAKEADLGGAEPPEGHDGLQDDDLPREDRDRAV